MTVVNPLSGVMEPATLSPHVPGRNGEFLRSNRDFSRNTKTAVLFRRFGPYHHARLNGAGQVLPLWGLEVCGMDDTYAWDKVEGAQAFTRLTLLDRYTNDRSSRRELHRRIT